MSNGRDIIVTVLNYSNERKTRRNLKFPSSIPITLHYLKDRDEWRPTVAQLCQRLEQFKAAQAYLASEGKNTRASLVKSRLKEEEKVVEIT